MDQDQQVDPTGKFFFFAGGLIFYGIGYLPNSPCGNGNSMREAVGVCEGARAGQLPTGTPGWTLWETKSLGCHLTNS